MSCELKPAKTFSEQLAIFENRNLLIENTEEAIKWLQQGNYYRISGYAFQFLKGNDKYRKPASFNLVVGLYTFDQNIRHILLSALENIEIYARSSIAYHFSHNHDRDGGAHYLQKNFYNAKYHEEYIDKLESQIDKNRDSAFVGHHIRKYDSKMPLWCAVEILPFSVLSKLYSNMLFADKIAIANAMGFNFKYLENWLHCFSILRNTCAHYGRLYNTVLSKSIMLGQKTYREYPSITNNSLFAYIITMLRILPRAEQREFLWNSINKVIIEHRAIVELGLLGFPEEWVEIIASLNS